MPILSPDHLFDQADTLAAKPSAGAPRQVDLRRAISAAYYGLFHFIMTRLADEFVGSNQRAAALYGLVYRAVDHRALKSLCEEVQKATPTRKYAPYLPPNGFGSKLQAFATAAIDLQEKRHRADYDPLTRFLAYDAKVAVSQARNGVRRFQEAHLTLQRAFLTLLLCPPR